MRLAHLDAWNARRATTARLYLDALAGAAAGPSTGRRHDPGGLAPVRRPGRGSGPRAGGPRRPGIETLVHYPVPPFAQPALASLGVESGAFPIAERLAAEVLSLPVGPHLGEDGAGQVVEALRAALSR